MSRTHGDRSDNEVRLLKKQIESLRKDKARMQRDLSQAIQRISELESTAKDSSSSGPDEVVKKKVKTKGEGLTCDDCGKGIMVISLRLTVAGKDKVYLTCNNCGIRMAQK